MPMHIVLTGNRGAGKSTALNTFKKAGIRTYEMDKIVHTLYKKGQPGFEAIRKKIDPKFCQEDEINREMLREWALSSAKNLAKLNKVIQPLVSEWIEWEKPKIGTKNAVFEMAAYFENEDYFRNLFDNVLYIHRDTKPSNFTNHQLPLSAVINKVDFLIENNGSKSELEKNILQLIKSRF